MADDEFDNKVKEQHDMNVDDAELLQQQIGKESMKICQCSWINQKLRN